MFKKLFNSYRNKSRQSDKFKWVITCFMEKKAKHFANVLQGKSQRIPAAHMKWYLACFCALGLTLSLLSILASGTPNRIAVTVEQTAISLPRKFSTTTAGQNDIRKYQQALQMQKYFDSVLQTARTKGQADSLLKQHRGLQDSIQFLKDLYRQEAPFLLYGATSQ